MRREWLSLPVRSLDRTRLVATGLGALAILIQFGQLGNTLRSAAFERLSAAALVTLVVLIVLIYRRGRTSWWSLPVIPAVVAIGAAGLRDPLGGTGLAMVTMIVCSLYDTTPRWFPRMFAAVAAVPIGVAITPDVVSQAIAWHSASVLGVLPQIILMGVLTRAFYLGLMRQERAGVRDATLARAGRELLAVADDARIRRIGEGTAEELVRLHPGVALLIVSRDAEGLTISFAAGTAAELAGHRLSGPAPDPAELSVLAPGFRDWCVDPLGADPSTAPLLMVVGGRRAVPEEVVDAFRSLSYQVMLADEAYRARVELDHRAHHDHLTGLPNRAKFLRAAGTAVTAGERVAVLAIDLDGFKRVNDEYGHAAGDELLVAVAGRIAAAGAGQGVAGRFGGDEFALLLTGFADEDEVYGRARRLCAALGAPVGLAAGTVRVGASVGVAFAEPGLSVTDLLRHADLAMYTAKAAGKNRVVRYGVTAAIAV
ncbi:GGDEF domain-containing protein [Actinoplanes oblitus]|uniref:GGDEF domain-containing protein n=1 Tax=Actinoplanes oblitus TaxID=3040509 RepID=A0ABY8WCV9_9ACTN|nr:GGDEF domain-containing protein [Actinoplanes oblitus]WIM95207.1 GGDEF domain-containing protein [Actinoplanes oblitus]